MLEWIYTALGAMMRFFNSISGHYALALLFYALVFKIVFLPFTIKQQKNQIKMAKLAPKIELIKAKYKGRTDQPTMQKQQQEIMELQQKEGYNPMSGCLPLLIQMPIILLLYAVIQSPMSYIAETSAQFNAFNSNPSAGVTDDSYSELLEHYPHISLMNQSQLTQKDISNRFYIDFIIDGNYGDDVSSYQAAIPSADELKKKEIAITGAIHNFVKDGYKPSKSVAELAAKPAEELKDGEIEIVAEHNLWTAKTQDLTTPEARKAFVESYGIVYKSVPNFTLGDTNLASTPSEAGFSLLWLIPVLAALAQWFSMWLMRKVNPNPATAPQDQQTAASMKIMDLVMPGMTLFIAFNFSGMLGIYWVYQSLLGLATSLILAKLMPMPKFTEEEIKEMRRQEKEVEKAARAAAKKGPKYRSLHYIDDEDYDTLPTMPEDKKGETPAKGLGGDIPEIKD